MIGLEIFLGGGTGSATGHGHDTRVVENHSRNNVERNEKSVVALDDESELSGYDDPGASTSRSIPRSSAKFSPPSTGTGSPVREKEDTEMVKNSSVDKLTRIKLDDEASAYSGESQARARYTPVGWDSFRSKLMILLSILFVVWAVVYFPLLYMGYRRNVCSPVVRELC